MRILISGSSGLIGSVLCPFLEEKGAKITHLVRSPSQLQKTSCFWDPANGQIDSATIEGHDVVINLAGENVASGRWNRAKKERIRRSRVEGTALLAKALSSCRHPPKLLINSSAIGYYGDRGAERLTEESGPGKGFLSAVCQAWEAAALPAKEAGIRLALLRTGVVLSQKGGALARMAAPFRLGLGGVVGSGDQYVSWIAIDDLLSIFWEVIENETLAGPLNAVSPNPITNRELTAALGKELGRPTFLPLPRFLVRLVFGQMGNELLLASSRVVPEKLTKSGYTFSYPEIQGALAHLFS